MHLSSACNLLVFERTLSKVLKKCESMYEKCEEPISREMRNKKDSKDASTNNWRPMSLGNKKRARARWAMNGRAGPWAHRGSWCEQRGNWRKQKQIRTKIMDPECTRQRQRGAWGSDRSAAVETMHCDAAHRGSVSGRKEIKKNGPSSGEGRGGRKKKERREAEGAAAVGRASVRGGKWRLFPSFNCC